MRTSALLLATALSLGLSGVASAQFTEDFSGDNLNPTPLGTFDSDFTIIDAVISDALDVAPLPTDVDVFSFIIEDGFQLDSIILTDVDSTDDFAFIAIEAGGSFPLDAAGLDALGGSTTDAFLAGELFGAGDTGVGSDLLAALSDGFIELTGAASGLGFDTPLPAGEYTIYAQQLGGALFTYSLEFNVSAVPEPSTVGLLSLVGLGMASLRRRV